MTERADIPDFFVYGEPSRALEIGFVHVETVMERKNAHFGHVAPHKHPRMGQITYWYKGSGSYRIEDRSWNFSAPAISFVPSGVVHGFDVTDASDAIVISMSDDLLRELAARVDLALHVPSTAFEGGPSKLWNRLNTLVRLVYDEYRDGLASDRTVRAFICGVLCLTSRLAGNGRAQVAPPNMRLGSALRQAIDTHYRKDWRIEQYISQLGTTQHLLDRASRELFGHSVKEAILERRLLEAKRLLRFTIRSIEDISQEIGFADPAYFSRFFRKRTGMAPASWRATDRSGSG